MQNYIIKIYPNKKQKEILNQWFFRATGVYNFAIKKLESELDLNESFTFPIKYLKSTTAKFYLLNQIPKHSKKCELPVRLIHGVMTQAADARTRFLKKQTEKPKLKGQRNKLNSLLFQGDIRIGERLKIPGMKLKHRGNFPEGKMKQVRIVQTGLEYLCVL